jgi:hypothetical protein
LEETLEQLHRQEKVLIQEPHSGWSGESYRRELESSIAAHGRAPQTITLHPETMHDLGLDGKLLDAFGAKNASVLVVSSEYDQSTITLYY